jgi:hypothetical protein
MTPKDMEEAETVIRTAIDGCPNIGRAIENLVGDTPVPHRAFMIYPSNNRRKLSACLVKPVSDWALGVIIRTLDNQGLQAALDLYQQTEGSVRAASFRGQLWERKVQRYFCSGNALSFTIRCLEDDDSSTMEWNISKTMSTYDFGSSHMLSGYLKQCVADKKPGYFRPKSDNFASFDAIMYQPNSPLFPVQISQQKHHGIKLKGPKLLQKSLLRSDAMLKRLRPLVDAPWIVVFVLPKPMETTFKKQKFIPRARIWKAKTKQYVLGLDRRAVFLCRSQP